MIPRYLQTVISRQSSVISPEKHKNSSKEGRKAGKKQLAANKST
jgi:hypothetical protein